MLSSVRHVPEWTFPAPPVGGSIFAVLDLVEDSEMGCRISVSGKRIAILKRLILWANGAY
ncbi:MAG: hypothetical protein LAP85_02295 [Acidobacteriia bacterium]|nr:hypothetical protein [Terriglobia bacterium]